ESHPHWRGVFSAQLGLLGESEGPIDPTLPFLDISNVFQLRWELGPPRNGYSYETTRGAIASGLLRSCRWCRVIYAALKTSDPARISVVVRKQGVHQPCTPEDTQFLAVHINGQERLLGYVYTSDDDPAAAYILARNLILDVGSPHTLALAKKHLKNCQGTHDRCTHLNPVSYSLPTRLIDCTDPTHSRLISTEGAHCSYSYAALSYAWGGDQRYKTTTSNISAYLNEINSAHLPPTILDALTVTRALGLRYLWIDAFCIVQDSEEDKKHEIKRMGDIYRGSYVTIIAGNAKGVSEGFLQDRDATSSITLPFICPDTEGRVGKLHFCPLFQNYSTLLMPPCTPFENEPINTRGWCLQEYLMSPRALFFTTNTLQYHCQTTVANLGEAFCDSHRNLRLPDQLFRSNDATTSLEPSLQERHRGRTVWWRIAMLYALRATTVPSDRFIAFGGVADMFGRFLRTEYVAGLWRSTLVDDLLWSMNEGRGGDAARSTEYLAPSWSWAALCGDHMGLSMITPVYDYLEDEGIGPDDDFVARRGSESFVEVIQCRIKLKDPRFPFGAVTEGILTRHACVVPCV
ncbi:HET-domain-containing protein, partial [Lentinus brumalis]